VSSTSKEPASQLVTVGKSVLAHTASVAFMKKIEGSTICSISIFPPATLKSKTSCDSLTKFVK